MLTSDLAINRRRGERVYPHFVHPRDEGNLRDAANLIEIFGKSIGKTRGELDEELENYVGTGTDYKILRGFIKLLQDRSTFETDSIETPEEIRRKVFLEAGKYGQVLPDSEERRVVLETVADNLETDADTVFRNLYADLSANQKLISFEEIEPDELLNNYNLAQAQALLYRCVEMKIRVAPSSAENYRAVFGWIKHFGLIHSVAGNSDEGYNITLTGAASLFKSSQKYGIKMAVFLPALLLCENWKMSAEIPDKKRGTAFYTLSSRQEELESHYLDEPEYKNPVGEKLIANWEKYETNWKLKENREVIDLGKTAFIPDFVLVSGGKKIYLDILGFWTPKMLKKRLAEFEEAKFSKFILAADEDLRGSREESDLKSANVIFFKNRLKPELLEELAGNL